MYLRYTRFCCKMTLVLKTCVYYRNKTTNSLTDKPGLYVFRKVLLYSQERNPEATIEKRDSSSPPRFLCYTY